LRDICVRVSEYALMSPLLVGAVGMLLLCPRASALNPSLEVKQYPHTAWTHGDGFMGETRSIVQTSDGYLWLGTEFGIVRFDGVRFVPWLPPVGRRLPSSDITALLATRDGTLWIGTTEGLESLRDGRLTDYAKIAREPVFSLLEDHEGAVWVGLHGRLCAIRSGNTECSEPHHLLRGVAMQSLFEDKERRLWAAGSGSGLWLWNPGPPQRVLSGLFTIWPHALAPSDHGMGLIAAAGGILRQVVGKNVTEYPIPGKQQPFARLLLRDRDDALWIGTAQGLLRVYRGKKTRFTHGDGLSSDSVSVLFEDHEGSIWVGTTNGIDRFREPAVFTISADQGLLGRATSVLAARDGSLWIGTDRGLHRWDQGQMTDYPAPTGPRPPLHGELNSGLFQMAEPGLKDDQVMSLFEDLRGRIWVAGRAGAAWIEGAHFTRVSGRLPVGPVNAILPDGRQGIWISYPFYGLCHVVDGKVVESAPWPWSDENEPRLSAVISDRASDGFWIGFKHQGIAHLVGRQVGTIFGSKQGLAGGRVWNLHIDQEGTLWAAMQGGLSRIRDGHVETLTSKSGLPCDAVYWAIEDDASSLWLYTACGLVRITRRELEAWASDPKRAVHTTLFGEADGVRVHALLRPFTPVVTKSPNGKLWFAHLDGVSGIDPQHLPFNPLPPPVHIEQVTANGRKYNAASGLPLPPHIRDLVIDYTALSLAAPEKVHFRLKLEGQDPDWREVVNQRRVEYSNLPPGSYRFRVIAANNSGVWNEAGDTLEFSIEPAYYQMNWFRALCVAILLTMVWAGYRLRVRTLQQRQQRLQERQRLLEREHQLLAQHEQEISALNEQLTKAQEQERIRIASELHDGVLQQITSLNLRLGTATLNLPPNSDAKPRIKEVQQKLIQIGVELRHLSHELHPVLLQESGLPAALSAYCEEFSRVRAIPVSCEVDESVADLSPGAALCLYRIAQEALGNVAKHSKAKQAEIRLGRSNGNVCLSVSDDGVGFTPDGKSGGLGLINMRERVHQVHGTFEFDSEPGRGTRVRATVPFRSAS